MRQFCRIRKKLRPISYQKQTWFIKTNHLNKRCSRPYDIFRQKGTVAIDRIVDAPNGFYKDTHFQQKELSKETLMEECEPVALESYEFENWKLKLEFFALSILRIRI